MAKSAISIFPIFLTELPDSTNFLYRSESVEYKNYANSRV
ncbi:hypothetical protein BN424_2255 [Carnobacterium maltaromaticum LMA28]|uniref:Uncharacterized protein n=1 Tax=Carnobacterium maltaromaticum LMA28 TaxID=1234679 RepID=K8E522_CARML|nr:hypothetical protein BN424_2255 [Carnobacterium maltaromaticum LMA28]